MFWVKIIRWLYGALAGGIAKAVNNVTFQLSRCGGVKCRGGVGERAGCSSVHFLRSDLREAKCGPDTASAVSYECYGGCGGCG